MASSSTPRSSAPLNHFYDSLTKSLDDLETMIQTDNNNFMSFQFLESVLSVLRTNHQQMSQCALNLKLRRRNEWYDEYKEEGKRLHKASKQLRGCVKRMDNFIDDCTALTTFLHANPELSPQACQQVIASITGCITEEEVYEEDNAPISTNWWQLKLTEEVTLEETLHGHSGFNGVIYATRNVSNTLLRILLYGLASCWPDYEFESYVYKRGLRFDSSFMVSTDKLQKRVESEIHKLTRRTGIIRYEYRMLNIALGELRKEFERVSEGGEDVNLELEGGINEIVENVTCYVEALKGENVRIIEQLEDFSDEIFEDRKRVKKSFRVY